MPTPQQVARTIEAECSCLRLRGAARALSRGYDAELRAVGLKLSQLTILVGTAMFGEGGATIQALADAVVMDRTTLTRNLRPLEKEGLLRLAPSPSDGRSRVVRLTERGDATLVDAFPLWRRAQRAARATAGAEVMDAVTAALDPLLERMGRPKRAAER